ncbi:D-2-hydroxyacid dehydrogenase [Aequorivita vladivostokensis]|uniref:3-phosphoglycerate dehydrogenase n=1 Tax=Aequorivita vladivostokensis TaxID=171194 RepID=A0ABR5DKA7_9FLAO|nr:D-2-hydroxyacid dehydrogenase [Aequorivita vladivostokensis]KJJ39205.1 3-phosphoglycerate dehydrogenase [Aequorivita vladivostokensis]HBL79011.1 3-phosphoglycerate dehydrogenase [Aequorivita sp.]|tara:strand:- start:3402 stop:4355 length:954 start_codon:yes stop_codon:yes gene_type:complete
MKVLANDGISQSGIDILKDAGFEVLTVHVAQEQLQNYINEHKIEVLLVRSATKVRKDIIDSCPSLKIIGRGGVGMDNIDVEYARENGIEVINTPAASSESVAELVFAHLFGGVRFLHDSNRNMPLEGDTRFKELKKSYGAGRELRGKTLGIIGFGRIGRQVAKIALGCGMKVIASDHEVGEADITLTFYDGQTITLKIKTAPIDKLIKHSDFISLHVPSQSGYLIGKEEISKMKDNVGIVNAARGGVLDENALLEAIEDGKVSFAALDVFENEPTPSIKVLMHDKISLTPHIGAATEEAQDRIGVELANQIISILVK